MKTIEVRIPLIVDASGAWTISAWEDFEDSLINTRTSAFESLSPPTREYIIVAEIELPDETAREVRGDANPHADFDAETDRGEHARDE